MSVADPARTSEPPLRALDLDLPVLASRAALELDNILLGRPSDASAVRQLADRLDSWRQPSQDDAGARVDPGTTSVLVKALSDARYEPQIDSLEQLLSGTSDITSKLRTAGGATQPVGLPLSLLRDFCVALSQRAISYRHEVWGSSNPQPHVS